MQVKKEDIKEKIKASARELFFLVPYKDASMRDLAIKSNTTVGNIYRYYENKEILYDDILKETYDCVVKLIKVTDLVKVFMKKRTVTDEKKLYKSTKFKDFLLDSIIKIIAKNSVELYILINNSDGSKYENTKDRISDLIKATVLKMVDGVSEATATTYSFVIISTISYLLKLYKNDNATLCEQVKLFFIKIFESI